MTPLSDTKSVKPMVVIIVIASKTRNLRGRVTQVSGFF